MDLVGDAVGLSTSSPIQALLQMVTALNIAPFEWPPNAYVQDGDTFDYIVVGCGAAGSVIANRLTAMDDVNVLCIEAGGDPPLNSMLPLLLPFLVKSKQDWNYVAEDDGYSSRAIKNHTVEMTSGKLLGGSSSLDHLLLMRGSAEDFNAWAEAASDDSWNFDGLYKYFKKGEKCVDKGILNSKYKSNHGTEGYLKTQRETDDVANPYLKSFKEMGYDVVVDLYSNTSMGFGQPMFTIADGFRQSHAYAYLTPIKDRKNLNVMKNSLVTKIIFEGNEAVGVKVANENIIISVYASKEVIVTAGTLNTPKLLMLSGIGPKEHLESLGIELVSDLPVGQNLQDHVSVTLVHGTKKSIIPGESTVPSPFRFPGTIIYGNVALNKSQKYPDYTSINGIFAPASSVVVLSFCSIAFMYNDKVCQRWIEANADREILYSLVLLLNPKSRGEVRLRSNDPNDAPLIKTGFLSDNKDLEDMVDYVEDFTRIENTQFFKKVDARLVDVKLEECANFEFKSRDYWRCYVRCMSVSTYHYCCTSPMGTVLDNRLRVRGVKRLRVADSSAMPTVVTGDNKFSMNGLTEKAADLIKEDHS